VSQRAIPAVFMRGGTSKGLFFHAQDIPPAGPARDRVLLAAMGSPDPHGRQLDGLGGGISSLSKVMIIAPSSRAKAVLDYTFGQVAVDQSVIDWRSNCGNLTSAVGPFAVDEGLINIGDGETELCLHNTNSGALVQARFEIIAGHARIDGDFELQGVAGRGAPIALDFVAPGGAITGKLLPTGNARDQLNVPGFGAVEVSLVDATTACVFMRANDIGLRGTEMPDALASEAALLKRLEAVRRAAAEAMGLAVDGLSVPKLGFVAPAMAASTLSGQALAADEMQFTARMISMGQPHRALPLTGAMCLAIAVGIDGSVVQEMAPGSGQEVAIAHPSGVLSLGAELRHEADGGWTAERVTVTRTARRLMEGRVLVPSVAFAD
jgi:2-methylaconitate cis-trans-isomerase PrpF